MCLLPDGKPVERFLRFIEIHGHGAENMSAVVTKFLEELGLDISNLRYQSYFYVFNMTGIFSGLQARIRELNPPCAAHSLNLVGSATASSCVGATSFFTFLQALYNFFQHQHIVGRCWRTPYLLTGSLSKRCQILVGVQGQMQLNRYFPTIPKYWRLSLL